MIESQLTAHSGVAGEHGFGGRDLPGRAREHENWPHETNQKSRHCRGVGSGHCRGVVRGGNVFVV